MPKRKLPRGSAQVALTPEIAIAAIGLFSAFADGEALDDTETYALGEMLNGIDLYEGYSEEDFEALGTEIATLIYEEGVEAVVAQAIVNAREEGLEEVAFMVALVIVVADGEVPEAEQEYVDNLCEALGISAERGVEIVDELFLDEEAENEEDEEDDEEEA